MGQAEVGMGHGWALVQEQVAPPANKSTAEGEAGDEKCVAAPQEALQGPVCCRRCSACELCGGGRKGRGFLGLKAGRC